MLVRSALLAMTLLAVTLLAGPALARPASVSLTAMLQAVPVPADSRRLLLVNPLFTYTRLDFLAVTVGPAAGAGSTRLQAFGSVQLTALGAGCVRASDLVVAGM